MVGVASFLPELLCASCENGGRVCLGDRESDENPDDEGRNQLDPVEPAPTSSIGQKAANERAD